MGRSKLASWNLINGFDRVDIGGGKYAEQPANWKGAIPGGSVPVSNPSKCNPFVDYTMLNFDEPENFINLLIFM